MNERLPAAPERRPSAEAQERVVGTLTRHFVDDTIGEEELELRLQLVYAATTAAELERALADLPAAAPAAPADSAASVPSRQDDVPVRISALLSGQERRMTGELPRRMRVRSRLGYVELDLTDATLQPGVTTIDVRAFMGYVQILLPRGAAVESDGRAIVGYFAARGMPASDGRTALARSGEAPSVVRITGRAVLGYAKCLSLSAKD